MYQLMGKMHKNKSSLQGINKDRFSNVEKRVGNALELLQNCHNRIQKDAHNEAAKIN